MLTEDVREGRSWTRYRPSGGQYCPRICNYVFGLAGTKPLARKVDEASDAVRTKRAVDNQAVVRGYM